MTVSVGMITYNHEAYVAQAIDSVLMQQTGFPFELVIGEDNSTDNTRQIVSDYASRYPDKIRLLLHDRNVGAVGNFEQTMRECRGKYVAFLDGDDYWTARDKLQRQVDFMDAHPEFAMCFHPVRKLSEEEKDDFRPPRRKNSVYTLEDLFTGNFISSLSTLSRGGLFSGFPDWHNSDSETVGDLVHHVMVASHGDIGYIDEIMGVHREHAGGIFSSRGSTGRLMATLRTVELMDAEFDFRYHPIVRRTVARMQLELARAYLNDGLKDRARGSLRASLRSRPFGSHLLSRMFFKVVLRLYFPFLVAPLSAFRKRLRPGT